MWRRGLRLNRKFWEQVLHNNDHWHKKDYNTYVLWSSKVGLFLNTSWHFRTFLQNFHLKNFQTTVEVASRSINVVSSGPFLWNVFSCQTAGTPPLKSRESNKYRKKETILIWEAVVCMVLITNKNPVYIHAYASAALLNKNSILQLSMLINKMNWMSFTWQTLIWAV